MTTEQLHKFHTARPFKPFRMHLADGRALKVDHPEMLAYVPKARTCALWIAREKAFETIDLLLVTSLEPFSSAHGKGDGRNGANGQGRKPR
jgi:hypothetical protein